LFNKFSLSVYCVLGTVLDARIIADDKSKDKAKQLFRGEGQDGRGIDLPFFGSHE
jgi:hypothetical protein